MKSAIEGQLLSQYEVLEAVKNGRKSECIDGRDYSRLANFFPVESWPLFGFRLKDGASIPEPVAWTRENVVKQLTDDLAFGFEKALDQRGLSADAMYEVVKMWMWVLNDELQHFDGYANYGLPLFRAVALKYGLENPIGNDDGNESKYASD